MSFSFTAQGTPAEAIATVAEVAEVDPGVPTALGDLINEQLSLLPTDAQIDLAASGHTGWGQAQTAGEINLSVVIKVKAAQHPDRLPEPNLDEQPG